MGANEANKAVIVGMVVFAHLRHGGQHSVCVDVLFNQDTVAKVSEGLREVVLVYFCPTPFRETFPVAFFSVKSVVVKDDTHSMWVLVHWIEVVRI